jgi:hypothetical protein
MSARWLLQWHLVGRWPRMLSCSTFLRRCHEYGSDTNLDVHLTLYHQLKSFPLTQVMLSNQLFSLTQVMLSNQWLQTAG